jgi:thiol-disulfide isomerase/thioredoxin
MLISAAFAAVLAADVLAPGAAAPAFTPEKFLKGDRFESFEPGSVYVVEFWATWCGPCVRAMPHLTELQKANPDLTVVGVAGFERGESPAQNETKVTDFLSKRGSDVGFAIALDTDGSMSTDWMRAARRNGIPCSFVVGKDGKIAYIGSPNASLDRAVATALGKEAPSAGESPAPVPPAPKAAPDKPASAPPAVPSDAPSVTEEVTEEDTDQAGESTSTSVSTSTRTRTENGATVSETVTETVTVTVKDGKKRTVKRREVTRSGAGAP